MYTCIISICMCLARESAKYISEISQHSGNLASITTLTQYRQTASLSLSLSPLSSLSFIFLPFPSPFIKTSLQASLISSLLIFDFNRYIQK